MKTFVIIFFSLCAVAGVLGFTGIFESKALVKSEHQITMQEADELTGRFQKVAGEGTTFGFEAHGELFRNVNSFLNQDNLTSISILYGLQTDGSVVLVVYGYDADGKLLDVVLEKGAPCPPYCVPESNLTERR